MARNRGPQVLAPVTRMMRRCPPNNPMQISPPLPYLCLRGLGRRRMCRDKSKAESAGPSGHEQDVRRGKDDRERSRIPEFQKKLPFASRPTGWHLESQTWHPNCPWFEGPLRT